MNSIKLFLMVGVLFSSVIPAYCMDYITLKTNDGVEFSLSHSCAEQSTIIKHMINDADHKNIDESGVLSEINSTEFRSIKPILESLAQNNELTFKEKINLIYDDLSKKKLSLENHLSLLKSANYLNCQPLLESSAKVIAQKVVNQFRNSDIVEMKKWCAQFNLPMELSVLIGNYIAQCYGITVKIELPSNIYESLKNSFVSSYAFSHDNSLLAVVNNYKSIQIWSVKEGKLLHSLTSKSQI